MPLPGEKVTLTRLIQTERYVVAVDVELVVPAKDPSEPCFDSAAVNLLSEVREHAELGDLDWLKRHGKVYAAVGAA
jgi:hypothetical protein